MKLPLISGKDMCKIVSKLGFEMVHRKGSHTVWKHEDGRTTNGNEIWSKTVGGAKNDGGYSVAQTSDEGYIITGYTCLYGAEGGSNVWLIKVGKGIENISPTASFTYSPENLIINKTMVFDAASSRGFITNYKWDFGDGSNATGIIVNHSYPLPGIYIVNLTIKDNQDFTNTILKTVIACLNTTHFDTGSPAIPYPSIMGTHNGTITPNQTITVNKLYTYPCTDTGGHSEYAMIWNETIGECTIAEWAGYIRDYHNTSFNKTLTLEKGVIYNYIISTGSYPQIHHTDALPTTNGWINCTEFTDANGKKYDDWIPAIKLE